MECTVCGKEFKPKQIKGKANKYCSKPCQYIGFKKRVSKFCMICGGKFEVPKSREKTATCCSKECKSKRLVGISPVSAFKKGHIPWCKNKKLHYSPACSFPLGHKPWNKGIIFEAILGEKNPAWEGGKSFLPYPSEFNSLLKRKIKERDNYKCQLCGVPEEECEISLSIHHIDYEKQNCKDNNLISLCNNCHLKTNTNRSFWKEYFSNKFKEVYNGFN